MQAQHLQLLAGTIASLIFMSSTATMLLRVWQTKDVSSFSWSSVILNNVGNLIYWMYVLTLPFGPIYVMHGFYTVATILLAIWCRVYSRHSDLVKTITQPLRTLILPDRKLSSDKRDTLELKKMNFT